MLDYEIKGDSLRINHRDSISWFRLGSIIKIKVYDQQPNAPTSQVVLEIHTKNGPPEIYNFPYQCLIESANILKQIEKAANQIIDFSDGL